MSVSAPIGEIETALPLRAVAGRLVVSGWCLFPGLSVPPIVRLAVDNHFIPMDSRCERRDVASLLPHEPAALQSGFTLAGDLPFGIHSGRFEALAPDGSWLGFKEFCIAVEAAPFSAVLDTPLSSGVLRDRVKVGGWALDPTSPITELTLRYGHREITCHYGEHRQDVPVLYPSVPHAERSGFTSADFLVAGHGPVRVRAKLADGRTVVAPTKVTFSIDRDENHGPELDLTASRISLVEKRIPHPPEPVVPTSQPLNLLFLLPGSFAANHALHVAALTSELTASGHACAVAVATDVSTIRWLDRPAFRGLTHAEAEACPGFENNRGPDIIHVWTTRENVRQLAEKLRARHGSRLIIHLEDNEQQILAHTLGQSPETLAQLPETELTRLLPADLSHPRRSREFLAGCDGVTLIMARLGEFVPAEKPCITLMPAADARWFFPRPVPVDFRSALLLTPGSSVLFYHGNVHAANAVEVRQLYEAVLALNHAGQPVTLIRTGLDRADFLGDLATTVAPYVINLGHIQHHHHLPPIMALADFFVQPGVPDAFNDYRFPSKLPEFFALGRPVILPRTNLGTTLRHGIDAYVLDRADAGGIARAITELRADPKLCQRLAAGAIDYAAEHFSWRRSAETLARFYATLAPS